MLYQDRHAELFELSPLTDEDSDSYWIDDHGVVNGIHIENEKHGGEGSGAGEHEAIRHHNTCMKTVWIVKSTSADGHKADPLGMVFKLICGNIVEMFFGAIPQ